MPPTLRCFGRGAPSSMTREGFVFVFLRKFFFSNSLRGKGLFERELSGETIRNESSFEANFLLRNEPFDSAQGRFFNRLKKSRFKNSLREKCGERIGHLILSSNVLPGKLAVQGFDESESFGQVEQFAESTFHLAVVQALRMLDEAGE